MTDTIDQTIYTARDKLIELIKEIPGHQNWMRGAGIGNDNNSHFIQLNVKEMNEEVESLPKAMGGFDIKISIIGDIELQNA